MGNRAECPACKSCSSDVYAALHYNYKDCPHCGCPHSLLVQWEEMTPIIENLKEKKISKDLILQIENLHEENAKLKTKIHKMYEILAWRDIEEILEPFLKVKKILECNDE